MEGKKPKDMNEKEYRQYYFQSNYWKSLSWVTKFMKMFYVLKFKFTKDPFGNWQERRKINLYNPFSYIFVIILVIFGIIGGVFDTLKEIFTELKKLNQYV